MTRSIMQKLVLVAAVVLFSSSVAYGDTIRFSWEPNVEEALAGYNIYCGASTGTYTEAFDVSLPTIIDGRVYSTIEIARGTWYCAATAYDYYGDESDYSNEAVSKTIGKPGDFKKEKK